MNNDINEEIQKDKLQKKVTEVTEETEENEGTEEKEVTEVTEEAEEAVDEIEPKQETKQLSREELRKKLKHRISSARGNRKGGLTKKKAENLQDSFGKVSEILQNNNIDDPSKIDANLIQNIMSIINKDDLDSILNKIKGDSQFKNILQQVTEASNQIKLEK